MKLNAYPVDILWLVYPKQLFFLTVIINQGPIQVIALTIASSLINYLIAQKNKNKC